MILTAPAKVNLCLKVIRRREDGYHDIETIFERVSVFDSVSIEPVKGSTRITCDDPAVPVDEQSLMGRAVSAFRSRSGAEGHFRIDVKKNIPVSAGLGGGSSDAAAILSGLNQLAGSPLTRDELMLLGRELGADIPFFLSGASFACGSGRGDIIHPISSEAKLWHVMVKPPFGSDTKDVYGRLSAFDLTKEGSVDRMFTAFLSKNDIDGIAENLCNDLQIIVLRDFPVLGQVFSALGEAGAKGMLLSGSGSTVFGLFGREQAEKAAEKLRSAFKPEKGWKVFVAGTF